MKIRYKLILGFLLIASLASVTTFFTLRSYGEISQTFDDLVDDPTQMVQALADLKQAGMRVVSSTSELNFIHSETLRLGQTDLDEETEVKLLMVDGHQAFESSLDRYRNLVETVATDEGQTLADLTVAGRALLQTSDEIIELNRTAIHRETLLEKREVFEEQEVTFLNIVDKALDKEFKEQLASQSDVEKSIRTATRETTVVTTLTFLMAISLGLYISLSISRRINKLKAASQSVGDGTFDAEIDVTSEDEIGDLSRSFVGMVGDLKHSRSELIAKEKYFRSLIEKSSDAVALFGADGTILYASPSTPKILGFEPDEITGINAIELIPPEDLVAFHERFGKLLDEPGSAIQIVSRVRHKNGSLRWLEGTFTNLVDDPDVGAVVNNYRDITDRKRVEAESEVIYEITQGVAATANLDELLQLIHRSIGRVLNADNCYVALYDSETDLLSVPFCIDKYDSPAPPAKLGTGLTAYVLKRGKPMLMTPEVIRTLTDQGEVTSVGTDPAVWLGVPLRTPKGVVGALVVQHYEDEHAYDTRDVEFLGAVGDRIALAIERKAAEEETARLDLEIKAQRERLTTVINNVQGVVWETRTKVEEGESFRRFDFVSNYIETMLGYSSDECTATPSFWLDIVHPDDRHRTAEIVRSFLTEGKGGTIEFRWIAKDGHEVWVESRNTIIWDDDGKPVGLRGIAVDITERKTFEQQLTHQALHDPLTKMANRVLFRDRVEHAISRTARKHAPIAVLFLDLDNFKSVNDSLGHAAGDELLVSVTERLQACLRASDTPARFGGDEFAILLEDLEHGDQASFIAERIRNVMREPFSISGTEVFISSSIGIAITMDGHETPEELLRNADVAMYMSKNNGRDRYTVFENEMHDVLVKRIRLESDMRSAIDNREFEVYYQPIVELHSERVMGMEALVRWNHPEHGLIPPLDFIPLAEETGLIVPLGRWIMEEACLQARKWQTRYRYGKKLSITINVASRQFQDDGLAGAVRHALTLSQLPPESLILEITESTMLSDTEATITKLTELKKLGIRFAIDDFGTGFSSLSYLQRFPVDILKIDKSFIDRIALTKEGAAVAKAIITMSETLNLQTIAEGIETPRQQSELQGLGCELGQGYHFARPLRAADMNDFLQRADSPKDTTLPLISAMADSMRLEPAVA